MQLDECGRSRTIGGGWTISAAATDEGEPVWLAAQRPFDLPVGVALCDAIAFFVNPATAADADLQLGLAPSEIQLERNQGQTFLREGLLKLGDLTTMEEQATVASWIVIGLTGRLVSGDVSADEMHVAVSRAAIGFLDRDAPGARALDFGAHEAESGLEAAQDVVLVEGAPVGGQDTLVLVGLGRFRLLAAGFRFLRHALSLGRLGNNQRAAHNMGIMLRLTKFERWSQVGLWALGLLSLAGLLAALSVGAAVLVHPPLFTDLRAWLVPLAAVGLLATAAGGWFLWRTSALRLAPPGPARRRRR